MDDPRMGALALSSLLNESFNPVPALAGTSKFQLAAEWGRSAGPLNGVYWPVDDALVEAEPDWWDVEIDDDRA